MGGFFRISFWRGGSNIGIDYGYRESILGGMHSVGARIIIGE